jgi:hypothetical protein
LGLFRLCGLKGRAARKRCTATPSSDFPGAPLRFCSWKVWFRLAGSTGLGWTGCGGLAREESGGLLGGGHRVQVQSWRRYRVQGSESLSAALVIEMSEVVELRRVIAKDASSLNQWSLPPMDYYLSIVPPMDYLAKHTRQTRQNSPNSTRQTRQTPTLKPPAEAHTQNADKPVSPCTNALAAHATYAPLLRTSTPYTRRKVSNKALPVPSLPPSIFLSLSLSLSQTNELKLRLKESRKKSEK